jgi:hypothetical protein
VKKFYELNMQIILGKIILGRRRRNFLRQSPHQSLNPALTTLLLIVKVSASFSV